MATLVFDVETNGLPARPSDYRRFFNPITETFRYDKARIVEFAYSLYDEQGRLLQSGSYLVKPNNFEITNEDIHGISNEMALEHGLEFHDLKPLMSKLMNIVTTVVAHNIDFDINVLAAELVRVDMQDVAMSLLCKNTFCTMKYAKCKYNMKKWPKLTELYKTLFPEISWTQQHRALDDVTRTAACYFEMMRCF